MKERITHEILENELEIIKNRYPFLSVATVARSFRGRDIHIVGIGRGRARMLYVGCHHGAEGITSAVLLDYLKDISEIISRGGCVLGRKFDSFFDNNRIDVIPMLNPDGVELSVKGCIPTDPMYSRLVRMNGGSDDFTKWQANGRGVDLNHNYDAGFIEYKELERKMGITGGGPTKYSGQYPESEPEVSGICRYLRSRPPQNVITLHSQGEEIYYSRGEKYLSASYKNGLMASKLTGYRLSVPTGSGRYGGLLDYLTDKLEIPCLTLECGRGENPLDPRDGIMIYGRLRELLITAPFVFSHL